MVIRRVIGAQPFSITFAQVQPTKRPHPNHYDAIRRVTSKVLTPGFGEVVDLNQSLSLTHEDSRSVAALRQ